MSATWLEPKGGLGQRCCHYGLVYVFPARFRTFRCLEHALEVARDDGGESAERGGPVLQQRGADRGVGVLDVRLDDLAQPVGLVDGHRLEVDQLTVDQRSIEI